MNTSPLMPRSTSSRRHLLAQLAGMGAAALLPTSVWAQAAARVPIADMHSHLGVVGKRRTPADLAADMKTHGATLVSWCIVADALWLGSNGRGITQTGEPTHAELAAYFEKTLNELLAYAQQNELTLVKTVADVDVAMGGKPSVLIATESAEFLGGDIAGLKPAFDKGLRQMQLVHYIKTPVGDASTSAPVHNGLAPIGKDIVKACETHGILLDLAHCSSVAIDQALEITQKPMVWSHGWVHGDSGGHRDSFGYLQRRLSIEQAKKIAARGGVVGLWGLGIGRPNVGYWNVGLRDRVGYAREVVKLVNVIGPDAVAFGSDLGGVGEDWSLNDYSHLREVVQLLEAQKMSAANIEKFASGNFARVLRATLPKA